MPEIKIYWLNIQNKYLEYSKVLKKFEELQQSETDKEHRRQELLKFQVNEIKSASLRPGEEEAGANKTARVF